MTKCMKCKKSCAKNEIGTVYLEGNPYKLCRRCEKIYHALTKGLKKLFVLTIGNIPEDYHFIKGEQPCSICGGKSNGLFKLLYRRNRYIEVNLCKKCKAILKNKIVI